MISDASQQLSLRRRDAAVCDLDRRAALGPASPDAAPVRPDGTGLAGKNCGPQQVVLTDVGLEKVVGVIVGTQVSTQKKVFILLTISLKFMMKILKSRK